MPYEFKHVAVKTGDEIYDAIKTMIVRGDPAIGIAGALATVAYGTALGVIRSAFAKDNTIQVFADEIRPR